ncbi:MAG TPA: hypothetical protein ENJ32_10455 [Crenotrichaceae bacterium]|nr:hypothetical protein [Crenotrichaceae bacterium]
MTQILKTSVHHTRTVILAVSTAFTLASCANNGTKEDAQPIDQKDYPTLATVEYVIECMNKNGGQNYTNLYQCTCQFDRFSKKMTYDEFSQAVVFRNLKSMPGETGAVFRDPPQAKIMRDKLKAAQTQARSECDISHNAANQ